MKTFGFHKLYENYLLGYHHSVHYVMCNFYFVMLGEPGDSRSWESPEKEDNVYPIFI